MDKKSFDIVLDEIRKVVPNPRLSFWFKIWNNQSSSVFDNSSFCVSVRPDRSADQSHRAGAWIFLQWAGNCPNSGTAMCCLSAVRNSAEPPAHHILCFTTLYRQGSHKCVKSSKAYTSHKALKRTWNRNIVPKSIHMPHMRICWYY